MMTSEAQKTRSDTKPWDISAPGFTHVTKRADTFVRFLEEPDSLFFEIAHVSPFQMRVRLVGPNANELIFKAQREYHEGVYMTKRDDAQMLVEALKKYPKRMNEQYRRRLAAQVAVFLCLDQRVRQEEK